MGANFEMKPNSDSFQTSVTTTDTYLEWYRDGKKVSYQFSKYIRTRVMVVGASHIMTQQFGVTFQSPGLLKMFKYEIDHWKGGQSK